MIFARWTLFLSFLFIGVSNAQVTDSTLTKSDLEKFEEQFEPEVVESFRVKTGAFIGSSSPQKYGGDIDLFFGKFVEERIYPYRYYSTYRGIKVTAGMYRGGYRYSIGYFDFASFISRAGYSLSATYLINNSFARFRESTELVGVQAELNLIFQVRFGVYREINGEKIIPMFGFGLPIGPNMYHN